MSQHKKSEEVSQLIDHLFRKEYGKVVSYLTSIFGFHFLETAQDIAQDTMAEAYQNWSYNHLPDNPQGWIFKVAKNKALNWVKREQTKYAVYQRYEIPETLNLSDDFSLKNQIQDSMLKMIFSCCHPKISIENQLLLILNILCGFSRKELASTFLTNEEKVKKKLFHAKKLVREQNLISLDDETDVSEEKERINAVCIAIYLMFNEGYNSSSKNELIRKDLCLESIRLTRLLLDKFKANTRLHALLSTMYFHVARFEARIDDKGAIVLLEDQNRSLWDQDLIRMGLFHLTEASKGYEISSYHLEASIAAQHCMAKDFENTNWKLISRFYRELYTLKPSPIISLNLAIISGMLEGADEAIRQLAYLEKENKNLLNYYLLYAALGYFHNKNGEKDLAQKNFEKAKSLTSSQKEIDLLNSKIDSLEIN